MARSHRSVWGFVVLLLACWMGSHRNVGASVRIGGKLDSDPLRRHQELQDRRIPAAGGVRRLRRERDRRPPHFEPRHAHPVAAPWPRRRHLPEGGVDPSRHGSPARDRHGGHERRRPCRRRPRERTSAESRGRAARQRRRRLPAIDLPRRAQVAVGDHRGLQRRQHPRRGDGERGRWHLGASGHGQRPAPPVGRLLHEEHDVFGAHGGRSERGRTPRPRHDELGAGQRREQSQHLRPARARGRHVPRAHGLPAPRVPADDADDGRRERRRTSRCGRADGRVAGALTSRSCSGAGTGACIPPSSCWPGPRRTTPWPPTSTATARSTSPRAVSAPATSCRRTRGSRSVPGEGTGPSGRSR